MKVISNPEIFSCLCARREREKKTKQTKQTKQTKHKRQETEASSDM